jgi:hypothetical protein
VQQSSPSSGHGSSSVPVTPVQVESIDDPLAELLHRGVEVRTMESLWPLHDAVVESSLQFSMIRMRNALPRCGAWTASTRLRPW